MTSMKIAAVCWWPRGNERAAALAGDTLDSVRRLMRMSY